MATWILMVTSFVMLVLATDVASSVTVSTAAMLPGAVYVTLKGVGFVSVPQSTNVQVGGLVDVSLKTCQVTPEFVMSLLTVAVKACSCRGSRSTALADGTSAMFSAPLPPDPPWQPAKTKIAASAGAR